MPTFPDSLKDWNSEAFNQTLKRDLERLSNGVLPLAQATTQGGLVDDSRISVAVFAVSEEAESIQASVGIFFSEIIGGCSCGDDPIVEPAYCRLLVTINKTSAEAVFAVVPDDSR